MSVTSGRTTASSSEWDTQSVYLPDGTSYEQDAQSHNYSYERDMQSQYEADGSSYHQETQYQADASSFQQEMQYQRDDNGSHGVIGQVIGGTTYYNGLPLWYYNQNGASGSNRTTGRSNREAATPETAPEQSQATPQQVQEDRTKQLLQLIGLQVADTSVEVPRLHGVVWGHPTRVTGVGAVEQDTVFTIPYLLPTPQAAWLINRKFPNVPDTGSDSAGRQKASEDSGYLTFTPTENKPLATYPVKITNVEGKPDVLELPVMPHLLLQNVPGESSTFIFHHVAWLFWPARVPASSNSPCSQRRQVAARYMN